MRYTNISDALKGLRSDDKITEIISDRYALVRSKYISGNYSEPSICLLSNDGRKIYFISNVDKKSYSKWFKDHICNMPKIKREGLFYNKYPYWRVKTIDNRNYIKHHRKLYRLINR